MVKLIDLARKQTRTIFEDTELLVIRGLRAQLDTEETHVSTKKSEENADKSEVLLTFAGAEIQDEIFKWTTVTAEIHTKRGYAHANSFADEVENLVEALPAKVGAIAYAEIVNSWTRKENGGLEGLEIRELTFDVMIRGKRESGGETEPPPPPPPHWTEVFDEENPYLTPRLTSNSLPTVSRAAYNPPLSYPVIHMWSQPGAQFNRPGYAVESQSEDPYLDEGLTIEQKGLDGVFRNVFTNKWNPYTTSITFYFVYGEYVFDKYGDWEKPTSGMGTRVSWEESKTFTPIVAGARGGSTELVYALEGHTILNQFNREEALLTVDVRPAWNLQREIKGVRFWHPDHKDSDPTPPLIPWEEYTQSVSTMSIQSVSVMSIQSEEPEYPSEDLGEDGEHMVFIKR